MKEYRSEDICNILKDLDKKEQKVLELKDYNRRYNKLTKLGIELMKLRAFYELDQNQKEQVIERSCRYASYKHDIWEIEDRKAKKKHGPFATIRFDDIGILVQDQEAIRANAILLRRHFEQNPQSL